MKPLMSISVIAELCHEANRVYCLSIGDRSQPLWLDAPEWQKQSALNGVSFHIENPKAGDYASHESWMKEKVESGWVYGEEKNPELKTHPCIVPFSELPFEQQFKDRLFRSIVHTCCD